jgi:riboflavin biosynthesis pyrimidine reductase
MTIHSDGAMNGRWIFEKLIDNLTVVVAPLLVGENGTIGLAPRLPFDVQQLKLVETRAIDDSYLFLRYTVIHGE